MRKHDYAGLRAKARAGGKREAEKEDREGGRTRGRDDESDEEDDGTARDRGTSEGGEGAGVERNSGVGGDGGGREGGDGHREGSGEGEHDAKGGQGGSGEWGRARVQARMVPEEGTVHGQTTREIKLSTTPRLRHCHLSLPVLMTDCICSTLRHLVTILSTEPR